MQRSAGLLALLICGTAGGAELQAEFHGSGSAVVTLDSPIDDAHLADPPGYFAPAPPVARVVRRIVFTNTGTTPIRNPDVRIDGIPLLPVTDPVESLGLSDARDLIALFNVWRDRIVHATTDLDANREPLAILHIFGAGFCGDDARALAAITTSHGAAARFARLNGHSVAEHKLGGGDWMLLDGDQNLFYLGWDNHTPVSEDDILADPLLALRTKVFGRHSAWELAAAWQNTSRFEYVDASRDQKEFHLKNPPAPRSWELPPGGTLAVDFTSAPEQACAASPELAKSQVLRAAACMASLVGLADSGSTTALPYPATVSNGHLVYDARKSPETACQAARSQFPALRSGPNNVTFAGGGDLRVTFEIEAPDLKPTLPPTVKGSPARFHAEAPGADRLWWQIAADANFRLVPPNLDRVADFASDFGPDLLDQTFLASGADYYIRVKARRDGVWSDWSAPLRFVANKPAQPQFVGIEGADGDQNLIRWKPCDGEMLVFGSNRIDFLPDVYGDTEVTRMENGAIRDSRPNANLLARVDANTGEVYVPVRACYRLIVQKDGGLSVPSALIRPKNMPARVLQTRHEKADLALVGKDVAVEMDLP